MRCDILNCLAKMERAKEPRTIHRPKSSLGRNFTTLKRKMVVWRKLMMRRMEERWGEKMTRMKNFRKRTLMTR